MSLTDQNRLADFISDDKSSRYKPGVKTNFGPKFVFARFSKSHRRANRRIIRLRLLIRSKFISKRK